jgi:hypothetical protein
MGWWLLDWCGDMVVIMDGCTVGTCQLNDFSEVGLKIRMEVDLLKPFAAKLVDQSIGDWTI